jgi:acyl-CoA thioester hydrolase
MNDDGEGTPTAPFSIQLQARWSEMDFNQHMRNAAFLAASEDCRMRFMAARGFTLEKLREHQIGPVVLEDRLVYRREIRLLDPFRVDLALAAITHDGRRMKVRNSFFRESDGEDCATVESVALWLDLVARKPIIPPQELSAAWLSLPRTDDFTWFAEES